MSNLEIIKQLREASGAGMGDCKKAIDEAGGDMDKAIEFLRKQGIAKAAKRSGREASEGIIKLEINDAATVGYMAEFNAETDFVVKNDKFQDFTNEIMQLIKKDKPASRAELMAAQMTNGTAQEILDNLSGTIGEKMDIKDIAILESKGIVAAYSHMNGKIGVLVALDKPSEAGLARDIAMQVAAVNPKYLRPEDVPEEELNKEKEIYTEQLKKEGKPENIIKKILVGKVNKYYQEVCLLNQEYIKDDKKKVSDVLGDIKIEKFIRFSLS